MCFCCYDFVYCENVERKVPSVIVTFAELRFAFSIAFEATKEAFQAPEQYANKARFIRIHFILARLSMHVWIFVSLHQIKNRFRRKCCWRKDEEREQQQEKCIYPLQI